ncbi:alkene reductase [Burkholderia sp. BCC1999]|uniref:oxidoreductase n=1 Tax=Burkholderia sp. BCC1999 TaxID=2817448 RepID=UPI002AC33F58|nr:alkene reductase [Burkholderia sp. BCC1999]
MHTPEQITGWRTVTDAVHLVGGKIVLQLMHVGRIAPRYNKDTDAETVAPSSIRADVQLYSDSNGMVDVETPRELETAEIPGVIAEYRQAALNAVSAGFDGVELHCTSGYLPMQFLSTGTNRRRDGYGGALHGRLRFVVETPEEIASTIGSGKVGFRICPGHPFNDTHDENPAQTYAALLDAVSPLRLAYLHVIRSPIVGLDAYALGRRHFSGPLTVNVEFDRTRAQQALTDGIGEAVSFGRAFIANPDLVRRFFDDAPLADFNPQTVYTPGAVGYTDYPPLVPRSAM